MKHHLFVLRTGPAMTAARSLLLAILTGLLPGFAVAAPEAAEVSGGKADAAFGELAAMSRAAALEMTFKIKADSSVTSYGAFISADGLALVDLFALAREQKPTIVGADGNLVKFGTILRIFPEQALALMKFNHRPKRWLTLAKSDPAVGETIAFVTMKEDDPFDGKVPPIVGPVMAIRSDTTVNLSMVRFMKIISLGGSPSLEQKSSWSKGCFVINRDGDLVAFGNGFTEPHAQRLMILAPVVALADQIQESAKGEKAIAHPLGKANPLDPATLDDDYIDMMIAFKEADVDAARRLFGDLQKRYPKSLQLQSYGLASTLLEPDKRAVLAEGLERPPPDATKAHQMSYLILQADLLRAQGNRVENAGLPQAQRDREAAIEKYKAAINLSPDDFVNVRIMLAALYLDLDRHEDALKILQETYPYYSESIEHAGIYERLLIKNGNFKEADKVNDRIFELEEIYRRR